MPGLLWKRASRPKKEKAMERGEYDGSKSEKMTLPKSEGEFQQREIVFEMAKALEKKRGL